MGCAVALVDIEINDGDLQLTINLADALRCAFQLDATRGHGNIIENTKPCALVRVGMMGASCQTGCNIATTYRPGN